MIPIYFRPNDDLPERFRDLHDSVLRAKSEQAITFIFPNCSIAQSPTIVQIARGLVKIVDGEYYFDVEKHKSRELPLIVGTQFGVPGISEFNSSCVFRVGVVGASVLSGAIGGISINEIDLDGRVKLVERL